MTQGLVADTIVGGAPEVEPWVRNPDWLPMPAITDGEQKYVLLSAVWEWTSNFIRLDPTGCAYTVDWGDGSAPENVANGVAAQHTLSWAGCSPSTLTSEGYRQAIIVVTPQDSRAVFAGLQLSTRPASVTLANWTSSILDVEFSAPYASPPVFNNGWTAAQGHLLLEHVRSYSTMAPDVNNYVFGLTAKLAEVEGYDGYRPNSLQGWHSGCTELRRLPRYDTSICSSFSTAFLGCRAITEVPRYDYRTATTITSAFQYCSAVERIENVNASSAFSVASLFNNCRNLVSVAGLVTSNAYDFSNAFAATTRLSDLPMLDTSRAVATTSMFVSSAAVDLPAYDFDGIVVGTSMFNGAAALRSMTIPLPSLVLGDNMYAGCAALSTVTSSYPRLVGALNFFNGCESLVDVHIDLPVVIVLTNFLAPASSLKYLRLTGTGNVVTAGSLVVSTSTALESIEVDLTRAHTLTGFPTSGSLRNVVLTGFRYSVSVAAGTNVGQMTPAALDALYTSLGTVYVAPQVVTVTNNRGVDADTPSIATSKGWTVTGS